MDVLVGFILTLLIFSYLWRDNPAYRLAVHILVGVSAGYAAVIVAREVIWPVYEQMRAVGGGALWLIPVLFATLLLFKLAPRLSWMGSSSMAILVGVGGAVALVGAVSGTLLPQVLHTGTGLAGLLSAILTVFMLLYFRFTRPAQPAGDAWATLPRWQQVVNGIGQGVLMITLGAIFAGVLSTSLVLLTDRILTFINAISGTLSNLLS
ncbi:MAG: hypothetical protein KC418_13240 [Anaerolineales bacterium]|nr:hypothetical protein [Anaerolineales bacterium]MCB8954016.1 hypothetical protein [Ardenticatenales bacterium]